MRLEYLPDGSPDCPLIRLFDFTPPEAATLGVAVADMVAGRADRVAVHELPGVASVGGCELVLRARGWDQAVVRVGPAAFECGFTPGTWGNVADLVEPFAAGSNGYQWLAGVPGEASLLLSVSGQWQRLTPNQTLQQTGPPKAAAPLLNWVVRPRRASEVEITGCDSVVFTFTRPREVFARVFGSVLARWPAALVDGFDEPPSGPEPLAGVPAGRLPTEAGHLLFYRDAAMARHMDEAAYVPMADGDGPFAVIARIRRDVEFEVSGLNELRAANHTPGGVRPPGPYQAWLCTPEVIEVTAVTPDDPASQAFSSWVLAEVKRACCPDAAPGTSSPATPS